MTAFTSCKKQNQETADYNSASTQNAAIGDTVPEIGKNIRCIFQDSKNNFWYGADGEGVYHYNGKALVHFSEKDGLCNNQVRSIQEDKSGNIWFGTGNGICRFDGRTFTTMTNNESVQQSNNIVNWKINHDDLWFEANGDVYNYDGHSLNQLQLAKTNQEAAYHSQNPNPYAVYCIFKDSKDNLWFGTESQGVCHYDGKSFTWFSESGLNRAAVRAIFEDKNGGFWFGSNGFGLLRYDGKNVVNFTEEKGLGDADFIKALKDKNFNAIRNLKGSLTGIMAINSDNNGDIWIGTFEAGVWRYDGKNTTNYTIKDGLCSNAIMTIYKDKKGTLLFGTQGEGVCKFNGKTFTKLVVQ
jgi:ligand-binding sensor domain-containing protein